MVGAKSKTYAVGSGWAQHLLGVAKRLEPLMSAVFVDPAVIWCWLTHVLNRMRADGPSHRGASLPAVLVGIGCTYIMMIS
jgi:hypothetical protein